jgi:AcrR family transcriptional regulator
MKAKKPTETKMSQPIPTKTRKSDVRRQAIVDAFIALVAQTGLEATSVDALAEKVGMRRNHVGYYFPSRGDLVEAAVRKVMAVGQKMTSERLATAQGWKEIVVNWSLGAFDWIETYPEHGAIVLLFYSYCHHDEAARQLNASILKAGVERAEGQLRNAFPERAMGSQLKQSLQSIQDHNWGLLMRFLTAQNPASMKSLKVKSTEFALTTIAPYFKKTAGRSPR